MGLIKTVRLLLLLTAALVLASCAGTGRAPTGPKPISTSQAGSKELGSSARTPELPQRGSLTDPRGRAVDITLFDTMAAKADYILVGEGHSNRCDHRMQMRFIDRMGSAGEMPVIGLEMVSTDQAFILQQFNRGDIALDDLPAELRWKNTWGYPFDLYRGVFRAAEIYKLPVEPLNVPRKVVHAVSRQGVDNLDDELAAYLPSRIVPPPAEQVESLRASFLAHKNMPSMTNATQGDAKDVEKPAEKADAKAAEENEHLERFVLVQSLWDSKMAQEAVAAHKRYNRPVIILAGGGHVEFGWGIAHRLKIFDPGATILTIMPWRGGENEIGSADLLYYCPTSHRSSRGMSLEERNGIVVVSDIVSGSKADKAGLRQGDIVRKAMGDPVEVLSDLHKAGMKAFKEKSELIFSVERDGEMVEIDLGKVGE